FPGTLLFASHDRYFTERMADGILIFDKESVQKLPLTLKEWEERKDEPQEAATGEERMRVETELQAVLGKLSMVRPGTKEYAELDRTFNELNRKLRELR